MDATYLLTLLAAWSEETTTTVAIVMLAVLWAAGGAIGYAIGRAKGLGAAGLWFGLLGSIPGLVIVALLKQPGRPRRARPRRRG